VDFINLKSQYSLLKPKINLAIQKVMDHGKYINGPEVELLEQNLASFTGNKFCISVANGTDALEIAQKAIGIEPDDEVLLPSYTWVSTAETLKYLGAKLIFCDVNPLTFNIDPDEVRKKITNKTKAIVAVSIFGQCADLLKLKEIATENNLYLIEDAAQSFGAKHHGKYSCSIADISTTSFFPSKPLGGYGDGGAIFTNNEILAKEMRLLARHGQQSKDNFIRVGRNSRLDSIQAAILLEKLKIFDQEIINRNSIHKKYETQIDNSICTTPYIQKGNISVFAQYTLKGTECSIAKVCSSLKTEGIPFMQYYQKPIHQQEVYNVEGSYRLKVTEGLASSTVSIPMSPYLTGSEIDFVINTINNTK
jgi:UDP-2-acetamido-2-deoxy-ribo-hexuluronate aminotransferase